MNYPQGSLTATEIWSPVTAYYNNLAAPNSGLMIANTAWHGYYKVENTIWVTAHTTQFTEPGWQYLNSSCGYLKDRGSDVSLKSPNEKDWSLIVETIPAERRQTIQIKTAGGLLAGTVHIWETNASRTLEHVADREAAGGVLAYTLDSDSLYTFTSTVGQHRGNAQPPPNHPFPIPYSDSFNDSPVGRAALSTSQMRMECLRSIPVGSAPDGALSK